MLGLVRVLGMDPGTRSFDICGLEDGRVFLDISIPTMEMASSPQSIVSKVEENKPIDLIAAPSGYGLPPVSISELDENLLFQVVLARKEDLSVGVPGLTLVLRLLKEKGFNGCMIPGVVHLPTVPSHRKANKIDLGTADKLCCAALGVYDQAKRLEIGYEETSFILVEMGYAFTAALAVEGGTVIDGFGGTTGPLGFQSLGSMDGELAYLLNGFSKEILFTGGAAYMAGNPSLDPEELVASAPTNDRCRLALEALLEGVEKAVAVLLVSARNIREILLSGRLTRIPRLELLLKERLSKYAPTRRVGLIASLSKEAAQGAALIADGLAGGIFEPLIEAMRIREAKGTVFDHLYIKGCEKIQIGQTG
ncbi:MAG: DUF1464 family protein [Candidatus Bathyarchaeia archaeon]